MQAHHREAAFDEIEAVDIKCAGDELPGVAARALNISVGVRVGPREHASYAGIVIAFERWEWRERIGNCGNDVAVAAEVVDHDDGALRISETPQLGLHESIHKEGGGRFHPPPSVAPRETRICT